MSLGERLREARERANLSARELSKRSELAPSAVSDIENNPDRSPRVRNVVKIAEQLGVSPAYLIQGTLDNEPIGLAESDVIPWNAGANSSDQSLETTMRKLPQALAPEARSPVTYRVTRAMPGLGVAPGDCLVLDLKGRPRRGDLVVATVADFQTGNATTVLRRFLSPYLIAAEPSVDRDPLVEDGHRTVVLGVVCATFKTSADFRPQVT